MKCCFLIVCALPLACAACFNAAESDRPQQTRSDGAVRVNTQATGSLQNPAWSPDGGQLLLTRFRNGYNVEPADLLIHVPSVGTTRTLVSEGGGNVNLTGAVWNASRSQIVFSSARDPHDEIFLIDETGQTGDETRVTSRPGHMAFEPSFSPDGQWIVFESHRVDVEDNGVITTFKLDGSQPYTPITADADDCRQPNWSPAGDVIVYQRLAGGQWDLWLTDSAGATHTQLTSGPGDKTDATFSPDGQWVVYSSNEGGEELANLYMIPTAGGAATRVTHYSGYDGAPSWSSGGRIAFESSPGDPDGGTGTTLWIIDAPSL